MKLSSSERLTALRNTAAAETINGISILKLFSWEGLCDRHVENMNDSDIGPARLTMLRRRQATEARNRTVVAVLQSVFNEMTCSLVALTVFGVFSYSGNMLTVDRAFPALLYISILKSAANPLLAQTRSLAQAKRSLEQLSFFCTPKHMPELSHTLSSPKQRTRASFAKRGATLDSPPEVRITNGSFDWGSNETGGRDRVLRGINVVFPAGKLTAIIGKAGCGKSSLLAALLGEMNADPASEVQLGCAVALSSQVPWMRNSSIRDNILFGCPMDSARYADVLRVCCLHADLSSLPAGDMTEFEAKGSNLTLSQKQKIGVARALYCGADVYMFDEPFASLTSADSSQLFASCFLEHLAGRTRILVTQQVDFLERVDHVVCMTDTGSILCCGSYAELSSKHPEIFSTMLKKRRSVSDVAATSFAVIPASVSSPVCGKTSFANVAPPASGVTEKAAHPVLPESYRFYSNAIGRNRVIVIVMLVALSQISRLAAYLWIAHWVQTVRTDPSAQADWNFYITVFGTLIAISSVLVMMRDAFLSFAESKAASALLLSTCRSLLRAPLSFFATTPASSIIAHLTSGQDTIDAPLPRFLNIMINGFTAVVCVLLVVSSIAWPFALMPVFIFYYYLKTSQSYRPAIRELKRLQAAAEPRINSLLSEAYSGAHIIRAFGLVDNFFTEIENRADALNRIVLPAISVVRWLGVRMDLCSNLIVVFSCIAAVFVPQYHPGYWPGYAAYIGFALSEAFGVKDFVLYSVRRNLSIVCALWVQLFCRLVTGVNWRARCALWTLRESTARSNLRHPVN
jgi:ABC-type multidrug transport system fused ATPase/permease subunit